MLSLRKIVSTARQAIEQASASHCQACLGWGEIKSQHPATGDVRYACCSRCFGTGNEPKGFWARLEASLRYQVIACGYKVIPYRVPKPRPEDNDETES